MKPNWTFRWPLCAGLAGMIAGGIALPFVAYRQCGLQMLWAGVGAAAVLACGCVGLAACMKGRMPLAMAALLAACAVCTSAVSRMGRRLTPEVAIANAIARLAPRGAPLAEFECPVCKLYVKLDRAVIFLPTLDAARESALDAAREFLKKPGRRYVLVRHDLVDVVTPLSSRPYRRLGSWPVGNKGTRVDLLMWSAAPARSSAPHGP